jgi:protein-L-isoaspartate(D-aspartate) O-methyltransferase
MNRQAHPAPETRTTRARMVVRQLAGRGVRNQRVLAAMRWTPREWFLPPHLGPEAYSDAPLPIGNGQTISQPSIQALSIEHLGLKGKEKVLEIGTGSGYQTALLAMCAGTVFSVERVTSLADQARRTLGELAIANVTVLVGDGSLGWRPYAPYDAIVVSAASPEVPGPLVEQLAPGGRLLLPLGPRNAQVLTVLAKAADGTVTSKRLVDAIFVPLLGKHGFHGQ